MSRDYGGSFSLGAFLVVPFAAILLVFWVFYLGPTLAPWYADLRGQAELAQAEQSRQIQVAAARARAEELRLIAEGEKAAATLRAEAIEIVGEATQRFPEYREAEFIGALGEAFREGKIQQVVYLPTEAGIPLLTRNVE